MAMSAAASTHTTNKMANLRRRVSQAGFDGAASPASIACNGARAPRALDSLPGTRPKLFITRAISWRPRRSAIRIVAAFGLLVDFSSFDRKGRGTSSIDRYTLSAPAAAIITVEV
jgi:hypothetical protein